MIDEQTGESMTYDAIVLGTGMKECILGGLLAVDGKKVLVLDRNNFYGADSASLNLKQCQEKEELKSAMDNDKLSDEDYTAKVGRSKDFNIDLCPKFLMAGGDLVKILLKTKVTKYLDFKSIGGSYVYNKEKSKIVEVPMTAKKAWNSSLLSAYEKKCFGDLLSFVNKVEYANQATWKASGLGWSKKFDLNKDTPKAFFKYFKIGDTGVEFIGHCVCLYPNDNYLEWKHPNTGNTKLRDCIERMQLYINSVLLYPETTSPYLYPMWGLGGLSEGFARLGAVHGGAFMLRRDVDEILYNDDGTVKGVTSNGETAFCKQVICDPTYLAGTDKVKQSGYIARTIMILDNVLPGTSEGDTSAQVIFPLKQTGHNCDVYLTLIGKDLECAGNGRWVAVCSTKVDSEDSMGPLQQVRDFITGGGVNVLEEFHTVRPTYIGVNQQAGDNIYICSSPDHTTHFQNASRQVMNLYHAMTGNALDLTKLPAKEEEY